MSEEMTMQDDNTALAQAMAPVVHDLYDLIGRLKSPKEGNSTWVDSTESESKRVKDQLADLVRGYEIDKKLSALFDDVNQKLETYGDYIRSKVEKEKFAALWLELADSYEKVLLTVSKSELWPQLKQANLKHLKPINFFRNAFHIFNATLIVVLYQYFLTQTTSIIILGSLLGLFTFLEITRRFSDRFNDYLVDKVFGKIVRPKERHKVNSATYYLLALTIMVTLIPKIPFMISVLVLGLGDPVANIIGKKFGSIKIYKEKSLQGTLAFVVASFAAIVICGLYVFKLGWPFGQLATMAGAVAAGGAIIELYSTKFDDNFTLIVGCSLLAYLWFM